MNRRILVEELKKKKDKIWDIIVIGGGATGLGVALDAASRGYSILLLEQSDFAKATSSRSTKLVSWRCQVSGSGRPVPGYGSSARKRLNA